MLAFRLLAALVTSLMIALPAHSQTQAQTLTQAGMHWSEYDAMFEDGNASALSLSARR